MKPRFFFPTVSLIAMIVLSACAPAATSMPAVAVPTDSVVIPATELPTNPSVPEATAAVATEEPAVQAIATSRGPDLEATDPTTVSLAAGQLQLIEFFRFT